VGDTRKEVRGRKMEMEIKGGKWFRGRGLKTNRRSTRQEGGPFESPIKGRKAGGV
jgi:hypothetical protein